MINQHPESTAPEDRITSFRLSHELEHELLSYPHCIPGGSSIQPIESVARIAIDCSINQIAFYALPSTGLARGLTRHFKEALETCMAGVLSSLPATCQDLLAWALFTGIQVCLNQVEYRWFINRLADMLSMRGWTSWEEVQAVMQRYIFLSYIHEACWRTA